ncbi:MAG TPA: phosphatidylserine decarboxylase family protein [Bacteroidales bacterium]|nr:phosphatidylserine decarboxylase family protein [Bacteroidales bacterium]
MKIHKEGRIIISVSAILTGLIIAFLFIFSPLIWALLFLIPLLLFFALIVRFFRVPNRSPLSDPMAIFSGADGTVVAIEEVDEDEFYHEPRKLVSVFMSIYNVHINWFPISGEVIYQKYHAGKFLVAWHPKSSIDNERTTVVIRTTPKRSILIRQIAGAVARRIVCYPLIGEKAIQNHQMGFIKFGSRIDHFLPLDADVKVELNQKVIGSQTILATFAE